MKWQFFVYLIVGVSLVIVAGMLDLWLYAQWRDVGMMVAIGVSYILVWRVAWRLLSRALDHFR